MPDVSHRPAGARPRIDIASYLKLTELADYVVPFALRVVCDLRLADLMVDRPRAVADLADATGTDPGSLARILRALAAREIFVEDPAGVFGLTRLAQALRSDHPFSVAACFPLMPPDIGAWGRMSHSIATGEPTFDRTYGTGYYRHLADPRRRAEAERFELSSESVNPLVLRTVAPVLDWSALATVVDVGGGFGSFVAGMLRRHPQLQAVVLDQPHIVEIGRGVIDRTEDPAVAQRCRFVAGDLFAPFPSGADAYLLKTILHDWPDEQAEQILRGVRDAMRPDSRVTVIESVRRSDSTDEVGTVMDVKAMVLFGGRARTEAEFDGLFARAGLCLERTVQTPTMAVLSGRRA